jgi:aldose 1-epimerase
MPATIFGTLPDGGEIREATISNGALTATVLTYGGVVRDIRLDGADHPLVLGFDSLENYLTYSSHFGAIAGRSANRIGRGRFAIDGRSYQVSLNEKGRHHLHGGFRGFGLRPWKLVDFDAASVTLSIASEDGDEGYPGRVVATCRYRIEAPATLVFEAEATADAPTLVNLAQHSYFNLDDSADILDHQVRIFADAYTPTDVDNIPTGEIVAVAGSVYDFRAAKPVRQLRGGERVTFDKNFVVDRVKAAEPRPSARLFSPRSGITLDVSSTEPGVQFYDGHKLNVPVPGLGGRRYGPSAGCCFEPQFFPDAPNHTGFPSSVLRPGQTYRQLSRFAFSRG